MLLEHAVCCHFYLGHSGGSLLLCAPGIIKERKSQDCGIIYSVFYVLIQAPSGSIFNVVLPFFDSDPCSLVQCTCSYQGNLSSVN